MATSQVFSFSVIENGKVIRPRRKKHRTNFCALCLFQEMMLGLAAPMAFGC